MNAALNYIIEANLSLLLFLACYRLLLAVETSFRLIRMFLLAGIFSSLIFPLIHLDNSRVLPTLSVGQMIPSYWLPEVVVGPGGMSEVSAPVPGFWTYATLLYLVGITIAGGMLLFQLIRLFLIMKRSCTYRLGRLRIAESYENKPTFSFFNFIFMGKAHSLSAAEKQEMIRHESIHAHQWHSFDILLMNVLKVFFWFNPFMRTYKNTFIQLHEFEADARAVENSDVDKYCSLLAKVALESADFTLASHFNQSLTVKRITMMRTIKSEIKQWKLAALVATLPLLFFFIACQDQVENDVAQIARNSSHALSIPDFIQQRFIALKKEHPDKNYAVLELNETATEKMEELKSVYGLPGSMEVFKASDGKVFESGKMAQTSDLAVESRENKSTPDNVQTFAIVEFNADVAQAADDAAGQDKLYTVVAEPPEYPGGYDAMMDFIRNNLRYPLSVRQRGIEGVVFISFVVEKDGSITDVHPIRGIDAEADSEAARVVSMFPNWIPGKQHKEPVRVKFVLPIKFTLNHEKTLQK